MNNQRTLSDEQEHALARQYFDGVEVLNELAEIFGVSYRTAFGAVVRARRHAIVMGEPLPTLPPAEGTYQRRRIMADPRTSEVLSSLEQVGPQGYDELCAMLADAGLACTQTSLRRLLEWLYLLNVVDVTPLHAGHNHPRRWYLVPNEHHANATILSFLHTGTATPKELSFVTRIPRKEMHRLLASLEAHGDVRRGEGGVYARVAHASTETVAPRTVASVPPPSASAPERRLRDSLERPPYNQYWEPFLVAQMERIAGTSFLLYRATLDDPFSVPLDALPIERLTRATERLVAGANHDVLGDRSSYSIALAKSCCSYVKKLTGQTVTVDDLPFVVYYSTDVPAEFLYENILGVAIRTRRLVGEG